MKSLAQLRADARAIFDAALESADSFAAVQHSVSLIDDLLVVGQRRYDLAKKRRILVAGCGKAAARMASALEEILGARIADGVVVVKYGHVLTLKRIKVIEAGHPIPDQAGVDGARQVMDLVAGAGADDLVLLVVSGGGSALLPLPCAGLTLTDKQLTTQALLSCGATIFEVNAVRKHLSRLKGGRLAELAQPAMVIALILSDVISDDLAAIASGPTVGDSTRYEDCVNIIQRYHLREQISVAVIDHLKRGARGELAETPKPNAGFFRNVQNLIVGSNRLALNAAKQEAQRLGYHAALLSDQIAGESRFVGRAHGLQAKKIVERKRAGDAPLCMISGGETTVTLCGDGLGGRNQEFALAAALEISEIDNVVMLSAGTDGSDGPTDAAGAIVDGMTVQRGRALGLSAEDFLARNDSYHYLQATADLLITGPTLTNVMDLQLVLVD